MPIGPVCCGEDNLCSVSFLGNLVLKVVVGIYSGAPTTIPNFYCAFICCGSLGGCNPCGCAWADIDCSGGNLTPSDALDWIKVHQDYTGGRAQGVCQSSGSWLASDANYDYFWCFTNNVICPNSACFVGEYEPNCDPVICGFVWLGACGYDISGCNVIGNAGSVGACLTVGAQQYSATDNSNSGPTMNVNVNCCITVNCYATVVNCWCNGGTQSLVEFCGYTNNPLGSGSLAEVFGYMMYDPATKRFWHTNTDGGWTKL